MHRFSRKKLANCVFLTAPHRQVPRQQSFSPLGSAASRCRKSRESRHLDAPKNIGVPASGTFPASRCTLRRSLALRVRPPKDRRFALPSAFVRRRRVAGRREDILDWTAEPAGRNRHRGCRCGGCPKARGASVEKWRKYFFSGWAKGLKSRGLAFGFFCRKCAKKVEKIFCIQKFLLTLQS